MDPFSAGGRSLDTNLLILRSLFAIDSRTNLPISTQYLLTTDGQGGLAWEDIFTNISTYSATIGAGIGYLPSSINTLTNAMVATSSISGSGFSTLSTTIGNGGIPGSITGLNLFSTTQGLGQAGYISAPSFYSSLAGLGTYGYISSTGLAQTVLNSLAANYDISTPTASTNLGLTNLGYISSSQLASTTQGLGLLGFISSMQLQSSILGLGKFNYISTASLTSSIQGIQSLVSLTTQSTIDGLGTYGYVSSQTFLSATQSLIRNINVDRAGNLVVYNANVTISSLQSLSFMSSFQESTLTFVGTNGPVAASTVGRDLYFSTAQLQFNAHSNYIVSSSRITLDVYPNFLFCYMNLTNNTTVVPLSTFLTYKGDPMLETTNNAWMVASGFTSGTSNAFQVPLKMSLAGSNITGNYDEQYVLTHRLVNALSSNLMGGLTNSNVNIYMASTNSVFVSIQNNLAY